MSRNGKSPYTPTQRRILALLADGMPHNRKEIHACLWDDLAKLSTIQFHIANLREILKPRGETIVCEVYRSTINYRHVRLLASATDGKY